MRKTKIKFNLMDALILLVIAAAAAALLYIFVWSEERSMDNLTGAQSSHISYVIEVTGLHEDYVEKLAVGDKPLDSSIKSALGTVTALETRDYFYTGNNLHDGSMVLSKVEGYVSLYITVEADAILNNYTYTVNGSEIYVGKLMHLSFGDIVCSGYCIALDLTE